MVIDSKIYSGACSCGRSHEMTTEIAVIEKGCFGRIQEFLDKYCLHGFCTAIYDENTYKATQNMHPAVDQEVVLNPDNLHANEKGVEALMDRLAPEAKVLIAVGSGTIHDITRYCAYQKGIPFISCPTAASVDGFCSSVAAMTWNGCKKTLTAVSPKIVLADIDIIKKAPLYLAKSGFGDMVGKYIALTDWKISHILTGEFYCNRIADMTAEATKAVLDSAEGIVKGDDQAYENLIYGLLLSGLAMQMMGNSRPASGAEHHISHIIEMEPEGLDIHSEALHGEKVGVATILAAREYHRLAEKKDIIWNDYPKLTSGYINGIFGERLSQEIETENKKDAAAGVTAARLTECWDAICEEIRQIPSAERFIDLYSRIGAKTYLSDIDVSEEKVLQLLEYSPCVRNRLTLMRLRRCI